jgi:hypothetical protein
MTMNYDPIGDALIGLVGEFVRSQEWTRWILVVIAVGWFVGNTAWDLKGKYSHNLRAFGLTYLIFGDFPRCSD